MYEVELKFPVDDDATTSIVWQLQDMGATTESPLEQIDVYYNHPVRDFGETDEALRIRTTDGKHRVTYKGPLVDSSTKTRKEIEIPFGEETADGDRFGKVLETLGFRAVRAVRKTRIPYHLDWEDNPVEVCLDDVDGLGTFVELEMQADEDSLVARRDSLWRLAKKFGLENSERRSYLCLLLDAEKH